MEKLVDYLFGRGYESHSPWWRPCTSCCDTFPGPSSVAPAYLCRKQFLGRAGHLRHAGFHQTPWIQHVDCRFITQISKASEYYWESSFIGEVWGKEKRLVLTRNYWPHAAICLHKWTNLFRSLTSKFQHPQTSDCFLRQPWYSEKKTTIIPLLHHCWVKSQYKIRKNNVCGIFYISYSFGARVSKPVVKKVFEMISSLPDSDLKVYATDKKIRRNCFQNSFVAAHIVFISLWILCRLGSVFHHPHELIVQEQCFPV